MRSRRDVDAFRVDAHSAGPEEERLEHWLFEGGAGQIPERLAEELGGRILLERAVVRVDQDSQCATVSTLKGSTQQISSSSPRPASGRSHRLQPATAGQAYPIHTTGADGLRHQVRRGLPHRVVARQRAQWCGCERRDAAGHGGQFAAQRGARNLGRLRQRSRRHPDHRRTEDARRELVLSDLASYFGDEAREPVEFIEMNWPGEKWTGGAYSANLGPGT